MAVPTYHFSGSRAFVHERKSEMRQRLANKDRPRCTWTGKHLLQTCGAVFTLRYDSDDINLVRLMRKAIPRTLANTLAQPLQATTSQAGVWKGPCENAIGLLIT